MYRTRSTPVRRVSSGALLLLPVVALASCTAESGSDTPSAEEAASEAVSSAGRLVIVGGSLDRDNDAVYRAVLDGTRGAGPFCVLPTASGVPDQSMPSAVEAFREHGADSVVGVLVTTDNPEAASDPAVVEQLSACSGYWFTGGVQSRVIEVFRPGGEATPGYDALMQRFRDGVVVAGSSAGAAMMPTRVIAGGSSAEAFEMGAVPEGDGVIIEQGMGFFEHGVVDQHFLARGRIGRLLVATLDGVGGGIGLGIDENTALVVDGSRGEVVGESGVILVDARAADRTDAGHGGRGVHIRLLGRGDVVDLETLDVTPGAGKLAVEPVDAEVDLPEDSFARWAFLRLLDDLASSDVTSVDLTAAGYDIVLEKAPDFQARSLSGEGVEGTREGLSVGPVIVSLTPRGEGEY